MERLSFLIFIRAANELYFSDHQWCYTAQYFMFTTFGAFEITAKEKLCISDDMIMQGQIQDFGKGGGGGGGVRVTIKY